ncbi:MAG: radical SAM/SPASM domain-containing protein [Thermomicrobiales bacterium]
MSVATHQAVSVGIGLTNECNLSCPHCYRPTLALQRLSPAQIAGILDNLDVGAVNLGVGENGMHPQYREILALLRARGVKTAITSNGYSLELLTDEELAGFHSVELSFDFTTEDEMNRFRGPDAWRLAIEGLQRCQRLGIPTTITAVMMNNNYDKMGDLTAFARSLGCDFRVNVYQPVMNEDYTLSYDEFWQGFANLLAAAPLVVCSEPLVNAVLGLETTRGCPCGRSSIRALPAGTLVPCPYWPGADLRLSDLAKRGEDVWTSHNFTAARTVPAACHGCQFEESCAGGCASRRALRGRLDQPDEYCPVVRGDLARVQALVQYTLANPEDVPKAGNACTTVVKTGGA